MSNRTAEANKAVAAAWEREQKLVEEGKGTRDWTEQQQKDILEYGKAKDEDGKAFEGQHMKSVEQYPEYQGDPDNIQLLSRKEHLEAHGGNWQNYTNGYYDPVSKEMYDFGDGPPIPCRVIELSLHVYGDNRTSDSLVNRDKDKDTFIELERTFQEYRESRNQLQKEIAIAKLNSNIRQHTVIKENEYIEKKEMAKGGFSGFFRSIKKFTSEKDHAAGEFLNENHNKIEIGLEIVNFVLSVVNEGQKIRYEHKSQKNDKAYSVDLDLKRDNKNIPFESESNIDNIAPEDNGLKEKTPQTKRPHDTSGYTRIRRGKKENVRGYSTGKKRDK